LAVYWARHIPAERFEFSSLSVEKETVNKRVTKQTCNAQLEVKLFLYLIKHHIIKTCVGNGVLTPYILKLSGRCK